MTRGQCEFFIAYFGKDMVLSGDSSLLVIHTGGEIISIQTKMGGTMPRIFLALYYCGITLAIFTFGEKTTSGNSLFIAVPIAALVFAAINMLHMPLAGWLALTIQGTTASLLLLSKLPDHHLPTAVLGGTLVALSAAAGRTCSTPRTRITKALALRIAASVTTATITSSVLIIFNPAGVFLLYTKRGYEYLILVFAYALSGLGLGVCISVTETFLSEYINPWIFSIACAAALPFMVWIRQPPELPAAVGVIVLSCTGIANAILALGAYLLTSPLSTKRLHDS